MRQAILLCPLIWLAIADPVIAQNTPATGTTQAAPATQAAPPPVELRAKPPPTEPASAEPSAKPPPTEPAAAEPPAKPSPTESAPAEPPAKPPPTEPTLAEPPAKPTPTEPAPAEPSTAKPPPAKAPPAEQELIFQGEATSILGWQVHDPAGHVVGRIVDILVSDTGQPRAAVIDFGGFMGVGNRTIAVAWRALHFTTTAGSSTITLDMTQDQIKATPDYRRPGKPAAPPVTVAAPPSTPPPVPSAAPPPGAGATSQ